MANQDNVTHVLDRLTFGLGPGDLQQVERGGVDAFIRAQLAPENISLPGQLSRQLRSLPALTLSPVSLYERYANKPDTPNDQKKTLGQARSQLIRDTQQSRLLRALVSPRQLQEVMVDFWFNHFNVFANKGNTALWVGAYEEKAIRPHALGKFRDILVATAKHPAMLYYLDNWRNTDPGSTAAKGPFKGLNENYARELLELHTLSVNGGYSQVDVESLTRILTGWGIISRHENSENESGFVFASERHDWQRKTFLGETIDAGGVIEGEMALEMLARHPATAKHISYKLAQHFVTDTPSEELVNTLSEQFLATDGDISAVLLRLFKSDDFWQLEHTQNQFRTPYQYVLAIGRAIGLGRPGGASPALPAKQVLQRLVGAMDQLGMPPHRCRTPDGYAQVASAWLSPDAILARVSMAVRMANLGQGSQPTPEALLAALGDRIPARTQSVLGEVPPGQRAEVILGSPEMMYR
ncbi:MAG: DUF1800 domain-containing protein [Cyanobacteria bacterium J06634_5]